LCLSSSSFVSLEQKQSWLTIWNVFPVSVTFIHYIVSNLARVIFAHPKYNASTIKNTLSSTKSIYAFAFSLATFTHIVSCSISLSSWLFPALFSPGIAEELNPTRVFLPVMSREHTEWPFGIHRLLQWDNLVGSTSVLAWAAVLLLNAYQISGTKSKVTLVLKVLGFSITSGRVTLEPQQFYCGNEMSSYLQTMEWEGRKSNY
jgi:hypothetical protein